MQRNVSTFVVLSALLAAACGGSNATAVSSAPPAASMSAGQLGAPTGADAAGIVWLCMPGSGSNPCTGDLSITVIDAAGNRTVEQPQVASDPPIDCFYVYPTISRQKTANASLSIDPEQTAVAIAQAAPFSQVCRVYAPIYPQVTHEALNAGSITQTTIDVAYEGVRAAFADYMAYYNDGRGVVVIGHSQGAMMLVGLIHREIDPYPGVRKQLVLALLMGGNVTVPAGQTVGGDFANIPACGSATETGCVVAYSSFDATPPADAAFGRVFGLAMFRFPKSGPQQILCVNPAAPGGGTAALTPIFPTVEVAQRAGAPTPLPATPYVSYPNEVAAECKTDGDAGWLQITRTGPSEAIQKLAGSEGPSWGLHDHDLSLGLGNLVDLVRSESAAYK
jgi:hypothetical protein